jgi:hypothetical protein
MDRHNVSMTFWIRISMLMPIRIWIRIGIKTISILMRFLPQVVQRLENLNFFSTFRHSIASLQCFIFHSVKYNIIFNILDSIFKFSVKKYS